MGKTQFMIEDPSKTLALSQNRQQLHCQTCFVSFPTKRKLREHVAAYQLEGQRLAARLVEVQMHLPLTRNYWNEVAATSITSGEAYETESDYHHDDDDNDDDDDDDNDDNGNAEHPDPNHKKAASHYSVALHCPYPKCRRRNSFLERRHLRRHFEIHIRCHELCVFCRSPFTNVSHYVRHRCTTKGEKNDAKEFYTKERRAQLRNLAVRQLDKWTALQNKETATTPKRTADTFAQHLSSEPRKRQMVGARSTLDNQARDDCLTRNALYGQTITDASMFNVEMPGAPLQYDHQLAGQHIMSFAPVFADVTIPHPYSSMPFLMPSTQDPNGDQHPGGLMN